MFVDGFKCGCSLLNLEVFLPLLTFGHLWTFNARKVFLTSFIVFQDVLIR